MEKNIKLSALGNKFLIKHSKRWGLEENWIINSANRYLKVRGFNSGVELSFWFVGSKKAKELNIKYRNKSYIPQVLGFPLNRQSDIDGYIRLGDIVICTAKVKYEAKFMKKSLEKIMEEWVEHGIDDLLL